MKPSSIGVREPSEGVPSDTLLAVRQTLAATSGLFGPRELESLVSAHRASWGLPVSWSVKKIVRLLETEAPLRALTLAPTPGSSFPRTLRYVWGDPSPFLIALSIRPDTYLTHGTAVFLHGLNDQIPKTIYVNKEQSEKPSNPSSLTQAGIDRTFRYGSPRTSNFQFEFDTYRVVVLNGKNTGRLEVTEVQHGSVAIAVTKLERTLIDIAVRPFYAGGVHEVLSAYRSAVGRISVNVLLATLRRLEYVYPYQQAIGFYMERAGFPESDLAKLETHKTPYEFYLTNRMPDPALSPRWNVWVPKEL